MPVLEQAMENGSLAGWVVLDHNAGARYNRNQIMLFNDWDNIDDVPGTLMESMFSDEERWQEIGAMVRGHDDNVWSQVMAPQDEN